MKKSSLKRVLILTAGLILMFCQAVQGKHLAKKVAAKACEVWVRLLDKNKYSESWNKTDKYFKISIEKSNWKKALDTLRFPLGKIISRKVKSNEYMTVLPYMPDGEHGEYVVIQYETSFKKKVVLETVTQKLNKDGKWRVMGYYIH